MKKSAFLPAVLTGVLLTAPMIALFFLGWQAFGFPFIPFDLFDALSRILPGPLIIGSIEGMVAAIRTLNIGATDTVAKLAEQAIAVSISFTIFSAISALFLLIRKNDTVRIGILSGVIVALLVDLALTFPILNGHTGRVSPWAGIIWSSIILMLWGALLGWLRGRLARSVHTESGIARMEAIDRRQLLIRLGGASAVITFAGAVVGALPGGKSGGEGKEPVGSKGMRWSDAHALPNADDPVKPAPGTRPEYTPLESHYRIDINTVPPAIKESSWKLQITGLVGRPITLRLADIRKYEPTHQFVTLACISNPVAGDLIGTTRWTGVSMQKIVQEVHPHPSATHVKIRSADDFFEIVALNAIREDPRIMLAYDWDGVPLATAHGFPLRIYIPDRYGMKQPKWIQSIEFIDHPEPGYWVKRGWDSVAKMKATSVIDTISSNMMIAERKGGSIVPIGGIAHAGARGISRVQVQVDQEPWQEARLREPLAQTTWVIWRYDWPFKSGKHRFTVRCLEKDGTPQETVEAPPPPSGATGLHSISKIL